MENSLERFNSKFERVGDRTSELEYRTIKIVNFEGKKEKLKKSEQKREEVTSSRWWSRRHQPPIPSQRSAITHLSMNKNSSGRALESS